MRIATFGDLHLGHSPILDKFNGQEDLLLRFDDHLSRTHHRIIQMGDIYQTDYGPVPGSRSDVLSVILKRYSRVVQRWESPRYSAVFGNHDIITERRLGTLKQIRLKKDNWRLWFIHGHQFDPFIGEKGHLPFIVTWMIGGLRRAGFRRLADFLEGPFYDFGQRLFQRLERAAWSALNHGKNDIMVMGHSHQTACHQFGKGIYLNSGACCVDSLRYASIDTERRKVEVRVFEPPDQSRLFLQWQSRPPLKGAKE
ncbi:MAG TPA: metallophosphoesterase [Thermodesulfobacteriota bacterium]|nr:metallophosphoesterase [Thermodesulfobacteriota bacterium]